MTNKEFLAFVRRPRYLADKDGITLWEDKEYDLNKKSYFTKNLCKLVPFVMLLIGLAWHCA